MSGTDKNIYQRINDVMKAVTYVKKDSAVTGVGGGYKAVTHDQVISVARSALVDAGIVIVPNQTAGSFEIKRDLNLKVPVKMGLYTGTYRIDFVGIDKADKISVTIQAHANDNGDKAPGKALTYAVKSALLKVLCLETGENDESREETRDKSNTIDQHQYDQLAAYCVQTIDGSLAWSEIGSKIFAAYNINSLEYLPKSKFDAALERCEKLHSSMLTKEQVFELEQLISSAGISIEQFCSHKNIKIDLIDSLPSERFEGATKWLRSMITEKNK